MYLTNKTIIKDQLKKRGTAMLRGEKEAEYFRRVFELARDHDYEGILELSRSHQAVFGKFFGTLEERAGKILQNDEPAGSYLFCLLKKLFCARRDQGKESEFAGGRPLEDSQVLELFFLLNSQPFGLKENQMVRTRMREWDLDRLRDWVWDKGLTRLFIDRYHELFPNLRPEQSIRKILEKAKLAKLLKENDTLDHYVFDRLSRSKAVTGMKTDVLLERKIRQEAVELRDRLYQAFSEPALNFGYIRKVLEDLHMDRELEFIERHGVNAFKSHLEERWKEGAEKVAEQYEFSYNEPSLSDHRAAVAWVNRSFLSQAGQGAKGKRFLHLEALLNYRVNCEEAGCYFLPENFVVVRTVPLDGPEQVLLAQVPQERERQKFIGLCLGAFFHFGDPRNAARKIVESYLESQSGSIRLRKAVRNALIALPVVAIISALLAWIYEITMNNLGEGVILGLVVGVLGISIAARNGFSQKIIPENHGSIPEYIILQRGIARIADRENELVLEPRE